MFKNRNIVVEESKVNIFLLYNVYVGWLFLLVCVVTVSVSVAIAVELS